MIAAPSANAVSTQIPLDRSNRRHGPPRRSDPLPADGLYALLLRVSPLRGLVAFRWLGRRLEAVALGSFRLVEGIVGGARQALMSCSGGRDSDAIEIRFPSLDAAGRERVKYAFQDALGELPPSSGGTLRRGGRVVAAEASGEPVVGRIRGTSESTRSLVRWPLRRYLFEVIDIADHYGPIVA